MKKLLTILVLASALPCVSQITAADAFSYQAGKPYEVFDFDHVYYFTKDNEILSLKIIRGKALVQKFDIGTAECLKAKRYDDYFPAGFTVESAHEIDGKYYFFYSVAGKNEEKLFAHEMDFASGEFVGNAREVASFPSELAIVEKIEFSKEKARNKFGFRPGYGNKTLLVTCRYEPKMSEKKNVDVIGMRLLGKDLSEIAKKEATMPHTERMMDNFDFASINDGTLFILAKVFHDDSGKDKKNDDDEQANYHLELLSAKGNSEFVSQKLNNGEHLFTEFKLVPNALGGVSGIGFYAKGKDVKYNKGFFNNKLSNTYDIDGIAFFNIGGNGEFLDFSYRKIPYEVVNAYEQSKTQLRNEEYQKSGNGAKIQFLNIRQAIGQPDGGIFLGSEQFYQENNSAANRQMYMYNNMLAAKLSAKGELVWAVKIPKFQADQSGINDKSYQYFFENGKHHLVYLDNPKNKLMTTRSFPEHYNDSKQDFVVAAVIEDTSGTAKKSYVFDIDGMPFRMEKFAVKRIVPDGNSGFLVESYKKDKEDILIKVNSR